MELGEGVGWGGGGRCELCGVVGLDSTEEVDLGECGGDCFAVVGVGEVERCILGAGHER